MITRKKAKEITTTFEETGTMHQYFYGVEYTHGKLTNTAGKLVAMVYRFTNKDDRDSWLKEREHLSEVEKGFRAKTTALEVDCFTNHDWRQ